MHRVSGVSVETSTYQRTELTTNKHGDWVNAPIDFYGYLLRWHDSIGKRCLEVFSVESAIAVISQIQDDRRKDRATDEPIEQANEGTNAQCICTATSTCLDCIVF